jgi:amino acid adenylation domain-containing protein
MPAGPMSTHQLAAEMRRRVARRLGIAPEKIGWEQPLVGLGVDSLAAVEIQQEIASELGVAVSLASLLEGADLRRLAAEAVAGEPGQAALAAGAEPPEYPLSYGQRALWFLQQLAPASAAYHIAVALRVRGDLDPAALQTALEAVAGRHPALRSTFHPAGSSGGSGPVQRVHAGPAVELICEEAAGEDEERLAGRLWQAARRPFDLERGPLLRVVLQRRAADDHLMVLAVHHLVADFASLALVFADLERLYPRARPAALPAPAVRYSDYVRWQSERLAGARGEVLWAFWRQALAGALPPLDLPTDRPRPAVQGDRGGLRSAALDAETSARVRQLAAASGATLFATLLAAFMALLHRYCGQDDILVGCPAAGRGAPELAGVVGYFVNPVVVRATREDFGGAAEDGATAGTEAASGAAGMRAEAAGGDAVPGGASAGAEAAGDHAAPGGASAGAEAAGDHAAPDGASAGAEAAGGGAAPGGASFEDFLDRVRRRAAAAFEHQEMPFALLAERLQPRRDPGRSPVFQVLFTLQQASRPEQEALAALALGAPGAPGAPGADIALGPLSLAALGERDRPAQLDLSLQAARAGARLAFSLCFNRDLFDGATIERLLGHLGTLLAAAAEDPGWPVAHLPLLAAAERHQLLHEWAIPGDDLGDDPAAGEPSVASLFEAQAERTPAAVALSAPGQALTYEELERRANQLANHLRRLGIGAETPVGVYVDRSPEMVVALLAVLKAGGAYLPLDPSPSYPAERIAAMLADARAPWVLTQERLRPALAGYGGRLLSLDSGWPAVAAEPTTRPPRRGSGESLAYVIYTSGSTGRPKGVAVRQRGVVNFLRSMRRAPGLAADDVLLAVTTLSFDIAGLELLLPLTVGARVALADRDTAADGRRLLAALAATGATVMQATPSTWRLLLAAGWQGTPRLRALCGGEALPRDLAEQLLARAAEVWNLYGPTETTIWSAACRLRSEAGPVPIGRPIGATAIHVAGRDLAPLPPGVPGELLIGGEGLARGYFERPELTAESFIPDPFAGARGIAGARLYRTGDLARRCGDGSLECLGRLDHQVKVRGVRIELAEVEAALAAHPAVGQAVVAAVPDPAGGERLVAYVVPAATAPVAAADGGNAAHGAHGWDAAVSTPVACAGEAGNAAPGADGGDAGDATGTGDAVAGAAAAARGLDLHALREHLAARLPEAFVPSLFVTLARLPLTANGKVDRRALPAPGGARPELAGAFAAPAAGRERAVAAIWRDVLGLAAVGRHDNFFDLGGHSLLLAQVHARLRAELGQELPLVELFRYPTVAALARRLAAGEAGAGADGRHRRAGGGGRRGARRELEPTAVVGRSGRFPGAAGVEELWRRLRAGEECISRLGDEELRRQGVPEPELTDPRYVKAAGVLAAADEFDAAFFGFSPREAELMDPQHRVFLECAWEALEDAGYDSLRYRGRIGVYAGVGINSYLHHAGILGMRELSERYQAFIANDKDFVPTRASYKLDLTGPSVTVQTACSSSLVAVHLACQALAAGDCDMALAGGVSIRVPQAGYLHEPGGIGSPDGHCRAFDERAAGTVFGSGAGLVVLKPLAQARADGDTVHAVIRGSAINNDGGRKIGYTAPSAEGQARVIAAALSAAAAGPGTIGYVEAHGTGTALGDPIEVSALREVWGRGGASPPRAASCALGSVKSNLGHLDTAAGICGLIKTVEALSHRELPPSLHCETPNPRLELDGSPFYVNTRLQPWATDGGPRRAAVSSFGIGGTNAHVVLEEAPAEGALEERARGEDASAGAAGATGASEAAGMNRTAGARAVASEATGTGGAEAARKHGAGDATADAAGDATADAAGDARADAAGDAMATGAGNAAGDAWALTARSCSLLPLSARTPEALDAACARLGEHLRGHPETSLGDAAHTLQLGRRAFLQRAVLVCRARDEAAAALAAVDRSRVRTALAPAEERAVAFLFPGQGAQHAGMGWGLYRTEPVFRRELDRCAELLRPVLGLDLRRLLFAPGGEGAGGEHAAAEAERRLGETRFAQPALFAVEHSLARLWMSWGVAPEAMLGHSIGEYVAACLAGVMTLPDALALVAARGRLMQEMPAGSMLAVELPEGEISSRLPAGLALAAVNGPADCVVSGPAEAVAALARTLADEGVRHRPLHTSHAFHSAMMEPILAPFAAAVARLSLRAPERPWISSVTGTWVTAEQAVDPAYWSRQLRATVRFGDGVATLLGGPERVLLEVGPGNALSGLVLRRTAGNGASVGSAVIAGVAGSGANAGSAVIAGVAGSGANVGTPAPAGSAVIASMRHPREPLDDSETLLGALGRAWLAGVAIDWERFGDGDGVRRRRVSLPSYPFERRRFWLADPAPAAALKKRGDLADWVYSPVWRQLSPRLAAAPSKRASGPWLVLLPRHGDGGQRRVIERLVARLAAPPGADGAVITVEPAGREQGGPPLRRLAPDAYALDPAAREGFDALLAELAAAGRAPTRVIHAWTLESPAPPEQAAAAAVPPGGTEGAPALPGRKVEAAVLPEGTEARVLPGRTAEPTALPGRTEEATNLAFDSLVFLAQACERTLPGAPLALTVLTSGLHQVAGEPPAAALRPEKALLLGPLKVLPQEQPNLRCQSIDLVLPPAGSGQEESEEDLVERLLAELADVPAGRSRVLALRGGELFERAFAPLPLGAAPGREAATGSAAEGERTSPRVRPGGAYLITGGWGGIGLTLARELARLAPGVKLILLGRSARREHSPAAAMAMAELEEAGAEVLSVAADVADPAAMAAALRQAEERCGPLRGVIHAAGVAGGGIVQWKTPAAARRVLAPKLDGTRVLEELLRGRELDFFLLCSSITAVAGGFGQSDYCAANAVCEAYAQAVARRDARRGRLTVAVGWDRWEEVGMAAGGPAGGGSPAFADGALSPSSGGPPSGGSPAPADGAGTASSATPTGHPLLGSRVAASARRAVFRSWLSAERHWVLAEHQVGGVPILPGTSYLEMARAARAFLLGSGDGAGDAGTPVELRDVVFLAPMAAPAGQAREVITMLEAGPGGGGSWSFRVASRPAGETAAAAPWQEHVRGEIGPLDRPAREPGAGPSVAAHDDRFQEGGAEEREIPPAEIERSAGLIRTGPRWHGLRRLVAGDGGGTATLELAPELAGDLAEYPLHPALLDLAAGAVRLSLPGSFLPLAYQRLRLFAPWPPRSRSRFRRRPGGEADLLTCDVTVYGPGGDTIAEIEGFSMRRLGEAAAAELLAGRAAADPIGAGRAGETTGAAPLAAPRPAPFAVQGSAPLATPESAPLATPEAASLTAPESVPLSAPWPAPLTAQSPAPLAAGIRPSEGAELLRRILCLDPRAPTPHLVVSTAPLEAVLAAADALGPEHLAERLATTAPAAPAHVRPAAAGAYAAPDGDVEQLVAEAWQQVLGIERIGVHDNFFELGGTSLSAIQLVSELRRRLGTEMPSVAVFEAPTIHRLAAYLRPARGAASLADRGRSRADKKRAALAALQAGAAAAQPARASWPPAQ